MRSRVTPLLIMSVERSDRSPLENEASIVHFESHLESLGAKYTKGIGVFVGKTEVSYVFEDTPDNRKVVKGAVLYYDQDAYLEVSSEGRGYLIFTKGHNESLGAMMVSPIKPDSDYTFINNNYLTFKGV